MFYFAKLLGVLLLATSLVLSVATPPQLLKREPTCYNVTFPVTISVESGNLPSLATFQALGLIAWLEDVALDLVFDVPATGTYTIAARYCEPEVYVESRYFTLQFLVHGLTYTRNCEDHSSKLHFILDTDQKEQTGAVMVPLVTVTMATSTAGLHTHRSRATQHCQSIVLVTDCPTILTLSSSRNPPRNSPRSTKLSISFVMAIFQFQSLVPSQRSFTLATAMAPVSPTL